MFRRWGSRGHSVRYRHCLTDATIDNDHTPENLRQDSINRLGIVETVIDAYDKFVQGAKAAEAGDLEESNDLILEGFDVLGQL